MDGLFFTALKSELESFLTNARIQDVSLPSENEFFLAMRKRHENFGLFISVDPEIPTVHLTHNERPENISQRALFFRRHLVPGRIVAVRQKPFERILHIDIEGRDDAGEKTYRTLHIEMIGHLSNVILTYAHDDIIIDALKHVTGTNRPRDIAPALKYVMPSPTDQKAPDEMSREQLDRLVRLNPEGTSLVRLLSRNMMGMSPFAARELLARIDVCADVRPEQLSTHERNQLWAELQRWMRRLKTGDVEPHSVIDGEKIDYWHLPIFTIAGEKRSFNTLSDLLAWSYDRIYRKKSVDELKRRLHRLCRRELKRVKRKAKRQAEAVEAGKNAATYRRYGDLLMAQLHKVPPKSDGVVVSDLFAEGQPVNIKLDPSKTPVQNATDYYKRYQKAEKTVVKAQRHLDKSVAERRYLESVLQMIDMSDTPDTLQEIEEELEQNGYIPRHRRHKKAPSSSSPLRFRSSDGFDILVGRNNRQNDLITMRMASADDLWLHVKDLPGAHVIIRCQGRREVPEGTVWEAAHLAAYYSQARQSSSVPVDVTQKRYVRKPRGARPGMVIYDNQRTLFITPRGDIPDKLR